MEFLSAFSDGSLIYLGLFLALLGGAVGLPIPEDIPLIAAGMFIYKGKADVTTAFAVCYFSIILGDMIVFMIGRRFGPALFKAKWFRRYVPDSKIRRVRVSLEKRSLLMIFIARHLFYLRSLTFLTCGAVKMHPRTFFFADAFSALISVPLMLSLGYYAAEHILTVLKHIELGLLIVVLVIFLVWKRYKGKKAKPAQ